MEEQSRVMKKPRTKRLAEPNAHVTSPLLSKMASCSKSKTHGRTAVTGRYRPQRLPPMAPRRPHECGAPRPSTALNWLPLKRVSPCS